MRLTRLIFGDGLVGVDGGQHKKQRKVVGPAFTGAAVEGMAPIFFEMAEKLAIRWEKYVEDKEPRASKTSFVNNIKFQINAYHEFECLSMDIIGLAGFQYDFKSLEGQRSELEDAFVNVTKSAATGSIYSSLRSHFPWVEKLGHYLSQEQKELDRNKRNIREISKRLVQDAKDRLIFETDLTEKGEKQSGYDDHNRDILSLLVRANIMADAEELIPEEETLSMIPTFLSGGYDNNSSEMSYAIYSLTHSTQTQDRLRGELLNPPVGCEDWRKIFKSLERLPYLDAVIRETLRLYSSAHSTVSNFA